VNSVMSVASPEQIVNELMADTRDTPLDELAEDHGTMIMASLALRNMEESAVTPVSAFNSSI